MNFNLHRNPKSGIYWIPRDTVLCETPLCQLPATFSAALWTSPANSSNRNIWPQSKWLQINSTANPFRWWTFLSEGIHSIAFRQSTIRPKYVVGRESRFEHFWNVCAWVRSKWTRRLHPNRIFGNIGWSIYMFRVAMWRNWCPDSPSLRSNGKAYSSLLTGGTKRRNEMPQPISRVYWSALNRYLAQNDKCQLTDSIKYIFASQFAMPIRCQTNQVCSHQTQIHRNRFIGIRRCIGERTRTLPQLSMRFVNIFFYLFSWNYLESFVLANIFTFGRLALHSHFRSTAQTSGKYSVRYKRDHCIISFSCLCDASSFIMVAFCSMFKGPQY